MKWENHDINVVEQANIQKFSKLDDIGTLRKLFESLFDDTLVDMIFGSTKSYDNREKAHTSFEITNKTFLGIFLGILLLFGFHKLQTIKCTGRRPQ